METVAADRWCDCVDAPRYTSRPLPESLLQHPTECGFPEGPCTAPAHRTTIHKHCGRPLLLRYCRCGSTGFTLDVERNWLTCYECGWPTRAWFEGSGTPAPEHLAGLRPVTYHEYVHVPGSPKQVAAKLGTEERIELDHRFKGQWVRD